MKNEERARELAVRLAPKGPFKVEWDRAQRAMRQAWQGGARADNAGFRPLAAPHDPSFRWRSMPCLNGAKKTVLDGPFTETKELVATR